MRLCAEVLGGLPGRPAEWRVYLRVPAALCVALPSLGTPQAQEKARGEVLGRCAFPDGPGVTLSKSRGLAYGHCFNCTRAGAVDRRDARKAELIEKLRRWLYPDGEEAPAVRAALDAGQMTIDQLKQELRSRGLSAGGAALRQPPWLHQGERGSLAWASKQSLAASAPGYVNDRWTLTAPARKGV